MVKIRIIDDDVEFAENLSTLLQQHGYTVNVQDHVEGLMDTLIQDRPDLLIVDVMFPGNPVAGFDVARAVRHNPQTKDIPVILLTLVNQEHPMNFSAKDIDPEWMPVQDFVEKTASSREILKRIAKIVKPPKAG